MCVVVNLHVDKVRLKLHIERIGQPSEHIPFQVLRRLPIVCQTCEALDCPGRPAILHDRPREPMSLRGMARATPDAVYQFTHNNGR
eukprot:5793812-Alexandrium_andersonii.AAC.1